MSQATCRGCGSQVMDRVLDLGLQPGSDHFPRITEPIADERWPLGLWLCGRCNLVQLGSVTPGCRSPRSRSSRRRVARMRRSPSRRSFAANATWSAAPWSSSQAITVGRGSAV